MTDNNEWLRNAETSLANTDPDAVAGAVHQSVQDAQVEGLRIASDKARDVVAAGHARLEEQQRQGVQAIQNVNDSALKVAREYAEQLRQETEKYTAMAREAQAEGQAVVRQIKAKWEQGQKAIDSAASYREATLGKLEEYSKSGKEGADLASELLALEDAVTAELLEFAESVRGISQQILVPLKSAALDAYEKTLEPIVEWFQQEVVVPIMGEGPGVLQKIEDWVATNAAEFKKVAAVASVFLAVVRTVSGIVSALKPWNQNRCENDFLARDFFFQHSRWQMLMRASKGRTSKPGFRLPNYDRVFRFRLIQTHSVNPHMGIGQCDPWDGGLQTTMVDCPGWGTGDFYRPTTMIWHFVGAENQKLIAEIWRKMGWGERLPLSCDGELLSEREKWPSDYEYNERYQLNLNGTPIITQFEGWPRISRKFTRGLRNVQVPYQASTGRPYVGFDPSNGLGQPLPEIPLTMATQIPLLYLVFWFAPEMTTPLAQDLLNAYETVVINAQQSGFSEGNSGFVLERGGELQPRGGVAWQSLSKIDAIPLLLDAPLTNQLWMGNTSSQQVSRTTGDALLRTAIDFIGMAQEDDPRTPLSLGSYKKMLGTVTANRGTTAILKSLEIQKLKSPLMTASIQWANAIASGSAKAAGRANILMSKVAEGTATDDDVKMINALLMAMRGPDDLRTDRYGNVPLRLD